MSEVPLFRIPTPPPRPVNLGPCILTPDPYHARILEEVAKSQSPMKTHCFKSHPAPPQALRKAITPSNSLAWHPIVGLCYQSINYQLYKLGPDNSCYQTYHFPG